MDEAYLRFMVRREIERFLNVVLHGSAGENTAETEDIEELFPGMPTIEARPVMHPYGLVSRAPKGTISVVARIGEHCGNRQVIGHRDKNRPTVGSGETVLYNQHGQRIRLEAGKIRIGSDASGDPVVLGTETRQMLSQALAAIISHTHTSSAPGAPTSPPLNSAAFSSLKASPVDDGAMLSDLVYTEKG